MFAEGQLGRSADAEFNLGKGKCEAKCGRHQNFFLSHLPLLFHPLNSKVCQSRHWHCHLAEIERGLSAKVWCSAAAAAAASGKLDESKAADAKRNMAVSVESSFGGITEAVEKVSDGEQESANKWQPFILKQKERERERRPGSLLAFW